jgi:hypothetical protein
MVRSWLLRIVFLTISFNSCLFPPITWSQGDQTLAVLGKIPTDKIIEQLAVSPNPNLAGGRAGNSKNHSTESRSIGGDSNYRFLIPLIFKNWSLEIQQPNPVPEITALDPNRASRGSAGGLLTITGSGFIHSSAIYFNTHLLATVFIDEHHLQAVIPPGVLTAAGDFPVVVSNPSPQGGPSNSLSFEVSNPIPVLSYFSP